MKHTLTDQTSPRSQKALYLHIGSEKTGTASLHNFLAQNSGQLDRQGLTYFKKSKLYYSKHSNAHSPIVASFSHEAPDYIYPSEHVENQRMLSKLKEDLSTEEKNVILSSEHFSSRLRSRDDIERLRDALAAFNVYVIFYMRPQYELYLSSYSTAVINGRRKSLDGTDIRIDNAYLNYAALLGPWSKAFGNKNIIVRDYRKLLNNDICADFLFLLGIKDSSDFNKVSKDNISMNLKSAEIIRKLNTFLPGHGRSHYIIYSIFIQFRWFVNSLIRLFYNDAGSGELPMKQKIESLFSHSNKEVLETYSNHIVKSEPATSPQVLRGETKLHRSSQS